MTQGSHPGVLPPDEGLETTPAKHPASGRNLRPREDQWSPKAKERRAVQRKVLRERGGTPGGAGLTLLEGREAEVGQVGPQLAVTGRLLKLPVRLGCIELGAWSRAQQKGGAPPAPSLPFNLLYLSLGSLWASRVGTPPHVRPAVSLWEACSTPPQQKDTVTSPWKSMASATASAASWMETSSSSPTAGSRGPRPGQAPCPAPLPPSPSRMFPLMW